MAHKRYFKATDGYIPVFRASATKFYHSAVNFSGDGLQQGGVGMSDLFAALASGVAAYRGHRADPTPSLETRIAQLEKRLAYAEELIDEGHVRLVAVEQHQDLIEQATDRSRVQLFALEHPQADPSPTIRRGWVAGAVGLALLMAVPALAADDLPRPPIVPPIQPRVAQVPVPQEDDDAKVCDPAQHAAELAYLSIIAGTQTQILQTLREIADGQARGSVVDLQALSALGAIESDLSAKQQKAASK